MNAFTVSQWSLHWHMSMTGQEEFSFRLENFMDASGRKENVAGREKEQKTSRRLR